jgi:hypothetical protein
MFALGVCLFAAVSSVTPTAPARAEPLASTYDQAACDLNDSGECAPATVELALELEISPPADPPILDCSDPRLADWLQQRIGTCDMPRGPSPWARTARLRTAASHGGGRHWAATSRASSPAHAPPRADDSRTLLVTTPAALLLVATSPLHVVDDAPPLEVPAPRLERPPASV